MYIHLKESKKKMNKGFVFPHSECKTALLIIRIKFFTVYL